jgi:hypothetical protein
MSDNPLFDEIFKAASSAGIVGLTTRVCRNLAEKLQEYDGLAERVVRIENAKGRTATLKVIYFDIFGDPMTFLIHFSKIS